MATQLVGLNKQTGKPIYEATNAGEKVNVAQATLAPSLASTTYGKSATYSSGGVTKSYSADAISAYNSAAPIIPSTLTSNTLSQTPGITLPQYPTPSSLGTNALMSTAGLGVAPIVTTQDNKQTPAQPQAGGAVQDYLKSLFSLNESRPSQASLYAQAEQQSGVVQKQQAVNNYQGQLNAITASANASKLSLEAQGRGQTTGFIGGEQARIDREAAIQSLPVAAQLSAAQGDLQAAQQHLDTLYKIYSEDAANDFNYKKDVVTTIYDYASKQEQRQLDAIDAQNKQTYAEQQKNIEYARSISETATQNGATGIATRIAALDPKSATYGQDIQRIAAQMPPDALRKANIANIYSEISARSQQSSGTSTSVSTKFGPMDVPMTLSPYLQTAYNGTPYVDLSSLTPSDKAKYAQQASAVGIKSIFDAATAGKLNAMSVSKENLKNITESLSSKNILNNSTLPVLQGTYNAASSFLGNADIKSFNAWRTAIINNVQALAGGQGSGLRINQAEINTAMENDLPVVTGFYADNLGTAQAKVEKLNSQLDTWTQQLLGGGNVATDHVPAIGTVVESGGKQYQVIDAQGNVKPL